MAKKPIMHFKNNEQFMEYAKWWQHRLNLDSWFIRFELCDEAEYVESEDEEGVVTYLGMTQFNFINKQATVKVTNDVACGELSLVHELCHLLTPFIELSDMSEKSYQENAFKNHVYHQSLEELAKDLILVKYPAIDREFFMCELEEIGL